VKKTGHFMASVAIYGLRLEYVPSKLDSPGKRQLLGGWVKQRERLERLIDPDEHLLAQ
jgi:hypothetical protein